MSRKRKAEEEGRPDPDPAPSPDGSRPAARGVRPLLLLFVLPLLSQFLQRGALPVRIVDLIYFVPSIAVYAAVWRFLYPNAAVYWVTLLFLLSSDFGSLFFSFVGLFGAATGMLFSTLPLLASPVAWRSGRPERLAAIGDYFRTGLRVTGVAATIFIAAVVPQFLGDRAINHAPGLIPVAASVENLDGLPVAVRTFDLPPGLSLADLAAHYDAWIRRPFYTPFASGTANGGFVVTFSSALPFFRRTCTLLVEREGGKTVLREAIAYGDAAGPLLKAKAAPAAPSAAVRYKSPTGLYEGTCDSAAVTPVPREMAEDSGFAGDLLFVLPAIDGASVRVFVQDPGRQVKIEHLLILAEDLYLRKEYPDFVTVKKTRATLAGADATCIVGDAKRDGRDFRLFVTVAIHRGRLVIFHGEAPRAAADAFEQIYLAFLAGVAMVDGSSGPQDFGSPRDPASHGRDGSGAPAPPPKAK